jgi:hypothetical protein
MMNTSYWNSALCNSLCHIFNTGIVVSVVKLRAVPQNNNTHIYKCQHNNILLKTLNCVQHNYIQHNETQMNSTQDCVTLGA